MPETIGLYQTVNVCDFHRAFETMDRDKQFSYAARIALFEHLEEQAFDNDMNIELDVIALCCEYTEFEDLDDFNQQYQLDCADLDEVREHTTVIEFHEYDPDQKLNQTYHWRFIVQDF